MVVAALFWAMPTAIGIFKDSPTLEGWKTYGALVAAFLVLATILIHFMEMQKKIDGYENTQPNVVAQKVEKEDVPTTIQYTFWTEPNGLSSGTSYPSTGFVADLKESPTRSAGETFERYYLSFKNIAIEGKRIRDAEDIHAIIVFSNKDGKVFSHEKPRWFGQSKPSESNENINIKANGEPRGLCLVIRQKGAKGFYVFGGDSYYLNHFDPFKSDLSLRGDVFDINIRLRDKLGWYKDYSLKMTTSNNEPEFEVTKT